MTRTLPRTLLIFDVDGTLLLNGTVVRNAYHDSFMEVCGISPGKGGPHFAGMTDRGIFRILMNNSGVDGDMETLFRDFTADFIRRLKRTYPQAPEPYLLPNVRELLRTLDNRDDICMVLGTGNIRETGYIKLARFGLDRYFPVGGFGGDYEKREDLVSAAINEARSYYGWESGPENAWVIGDTPKDVEAGKLNGTKTLAVASGIVSRDELEKSNADALIDDFMDLEQVLRIVL